MFKCKFCGKNKKVRPKILKGDLQDYTYVATVRVNNEREAKDLIWMRTDKLTGYTFAIQSVEKIDETTYKVFSQCSTLKNKICGEK